VADCEIVLDGAARTVTVNGVEEALPADFSVRGVHTLHVKRCDDRMYVLLDHYELFVGTVSAPSSFCFTSNENFSIKNFFLTE
jgi:hypothetical protein